jgi:hypothetical protein
LIGRDRSRGFEDVGFVVVAKDDATTEGNMNWRCDWSVYIVGLDRGSRVKLRSFSRDGSTETAEGIVGTKSVQ